MATEWQDMMADALPAGGFMENVAVFQSGTGTLIQAVIERDGVERNEQVQSVNVERTASVVFSPRSTDGVVTPAVGDRVRFWDKRHATNDDSDLTDATAPAGSTTYTIERIAQGNMFKAFCKATPVRHVTPMRSGR